MLEGALGIIEVLLIIFQMKKSRLRLKEIKGLSPKSLWRLMLQPELGRNSSPYAEGSLSTVSLWWERKHTSLQADRLRSRTLCFGADEWCALGQISFGTLFFVFILKNAIVVVVNCRADRKMR